MLPIEKAMSYQSMRDDFSGCHYCSRLTVKNAEDAFADFRMIEEGFYLY